MHARELADSVLRFFHLIAQRERLPDADELAAQIERDEKAAEAYRELHAVAEKVVEVLPVRDDVVVPDKKSQPSPRKKTPRTTKPKAKKAVKPAPKRGKK